MRASRLLRLLLLLQNRGKMTAGQLAEELEVARRTVLRDVDALTEAGLPVVVHRGAGGGIELGFQYRTRLTGLSTDEAEALGVLLSHRALTLEPLGLEVAARAASNKLLESLPDGVREVAMRARSRFRFEPRREPNDDPRVLALATAVREQRCVRIRARGPAPVIIHPVALVYGPRGWAVVDQQHPDRPIPLARCDDLAISAHRFDRV